MLLKMLEWHDPDRDADRKQYETNLKRFRERRVLPDPLHLTAVATRSSARSERGSYPVRGQESQRRSESDWPRRETPRPQQPPKKKEPEIRDSTDRTRSLAEEMKKRLEEQEKKKPK